MTNSLPGARAARLRTLGILTLAALPRTALAQDAQPPDGSPVLRVCANPDNLPYSNERQQGLENKIALVVGRDLGAAVQYTWLPPGPDVLRQTLSDGGCDLAVGVPVGFDHVTTTKPYYRSSYVFVDGSKLQVASLADPALRPLRVGFPRPNENELPPLPLVERDLKKAVQHQLSSGATLVEDSPADLIQSLSRRELDLAIGWGPVMGFYAARANPPLHVRPLPPKDAPRGRAVVLDIAMGVRPGDPAFKTSINAILAKRRAKIEGLLDAYGVPKLPLPAPKGRKP